MKAFWMSLQPRERLTLIVGTIALSLLLLYAAVLEPYQRELRRLEESVREQRQTLVWMEQAAVEARQLKAGSGTRARASGQSLLALVDSAAKAQGLGAALKRVQPDGSEGVRVWMEQAAFDDLLRWVDKLQAEQGVHIKSLAVERQQGAGRIDARIALERGAAG